MMKKKARRNAEIKLIRYLGDDWVEIERNHIDDYVRISNIKYLKEFLKKKSDYLTDVRNIRSNDTIMIKPQGYIERVTDWETDTHYLVYKPTIREKIIWFTENFPERIDYWNGNNLAPLLEQIQDSYNLYHNENTTTVPRHIGLNFSDLDMAYHKHEFDLNNPENITTNLNYLTNHGKEKKQHGH